MQPSTPQPSVWQQLRSNQLTCEQALNLLVDPQGNLNQDRLDPELSQRFAQTLANRPQPHPVIPLLLWCNCYYLGSPTVPSPEVLRQLAHATDTQIQIVALSEKSYRAWFYGQKLDANRISAAPLVNPMTGEQEQENISEVTELSLAKAGDQIGRIRTIISGALRNRASDIHLEPTAEGLRVRYRIDGILRDITTLPLDLGRKAIVALKVMSNMDIAESRRPQDARIGENYSVDPNLELGLDMRVSTLPCVGGEKAVIRLLPRQNSFSQINGLGFTETTLAIYTTWLQQPQGLIIFTGPTGSGKTTTLYTSLQAVAKEQVNVVTVEDPVEYVLPRITQTQVHEAAGMTFAVGLRAILRQDPDIVMVGEVRDNETAETVVRAALTGHLVLTTMHTNNAISTLPRLKDIGPDPGLISDALLGVVAQRLVRRVCPHCSEPYQPTAAELQALGIEREQAQPDAWRRGRGCRQCFNSGYQGREAIIEMLNVDDRVRQAIYEGTMTHLHRHLDETNFASFRTAAIHKVTTGVTTVSEILRVLPHSAMSHRTYEGSGSRNKRLKLLSPATQRQPASQEQSWVRAKS